MKKLILLFIFMLCSSLSIAYERVFYEDFETTTFTDHFLENQFGSNTEGYWLQMLAEVSQDIDTYAGTYSMMYNPYAPVSTDNPHTNCGFGNLTYGNLSNFDFGTIESRYWYFRWKQKWEVDTGTTGNVKMWYMGGQGDYYYIAHGGGLVYVIRDEANGSIIASGNTSVTDVDLDDGGWHIFELFIDFGTGSSDGDTNLKIDGVTQYNETGLTFVDTTTPVPGILWPGNGDTLTGDKEINLDELEAYTLDNATDIPVGWNYTPTAIDAASYASNVHYNSGGRRIVRVENTTIALVNDSSSDHIYRSTNDGTSWAEIDTELGFSSCLVSGKDNYVYHFSRSGSNLRMVKFLYNGTPPSPTNIYTGLVGSNHGAYVQINATVDASGGLYLFYHDDDDTDGTDTLFMIKSTNEGVTWSSPITVRADAVGDSWGYVHSDVMANGTLVIGYSEWGSGSTQFGYSTDQGDTWSHVAVYTDSGSGPIYNPAVLPVDSTVYIFANSYPDNGLVFSKTSNLTTWSSFSSIQAYHSNGYADPSPALGSDGAIYVAFRGHNVLTSDSDDLREYVARSSDGGDSWTFPFNNESGGRVGTRSIMRYQTHYNYGGPLQWTWLEDVSANYPTFYAVNSDVTLATTLTPVATINQTSGTTVTNSSFQITGTATATTGRTIASVTCAGQTVIIDDGTADELAENFTINATLSEGLNTFTIVTTDNEGDTNSVVFNVTYNATPVVGSGKASISHTGIKTSISHIGTKTQITN